MEIAIYRVPRDWTAIGLHNLALKRGSELALSPSHSRLLLKYPFYDRRAVEKEEGYFFIPVNYT